MPKCCTALSYILILCLLFPTKPVLLPGFSLLHCTHTLLSLLLYFLFHLLGQFLLVLLLLLPFWNLLCLSVFMRSCTKNFSLGTALRLWSIISAQSPEEMPPLVLGEFLSECYGHLHLWDMSWLTQLCRPKHPLLCLCLCLKGSSVWTHGTCLLGTKVLDPRPPSILLVMHNCLGLHPGFSAVLSTCRSWLRYCDQF